MKTAILIFLFVSAIVAIGTLAYVTVDFIVEKSKKNKAVPVAAAPTPVPVFVPMPVMQPITVPEAKQEISDHIVEHIDAEEADTMISDEVAMVAAIEEEGAGTGYKTFINIGDIDSKFEANETVTLQALKDKGMVVKKAGRIKILADGELTKPLTVKAESFSIQAIKMIELTGGTVVILK